MIGTLTPQQIRILVGDRWEHEPETVAAGLQVPAPWRVPESVEFGGGIGRVEVRRADTVFEVRESLLEADRIGGRILLVTALGEGELGLDVTARLARRRLYQVDHRSGLLSLFQATRLDPAAADPVLARVLSAHAPPDGYPPATAGVLDAGTAWRAVCRHVLGIEGGEPDLVGLLVWSSEEAEVARLRSADPDLRERFTARTGNLLGEPGATLLRFVDVAGTDALALAAVCEVVFGRDGTGDEVLRASATRMERFHGDRPIDGDAGRLLGRAASEAVAALDRRHSAGGTPSPARDSLVRADELVGVLRCGGQVGRSRLTPAGFKRRLDDLGERVAEAAGTPSAEGVRRCEGALAALEDHRAASGGRRQEVATAQMAVRLVRWLHAGRRTAEVDNSFPNTAVRYVHDGAWADRARVPLARGGGGLLGAAYRQLGEAVAARRATENLAFAERAAQWCGDPAGRRHDVVGVEDVLDRVLAPAARNARLLLIVLDGMSWAVSHELLEDLRDDGWEEVTPEGFGPDPPPVIAAVPSVTAHSRTGLLSGRLETGDGPTEKRNFAEHPALAAAGDRRRPPVLFHKGELTDGSRGPVADGVRAAVLDPAVRVVGAVVNAVDDRLSDAQQIVDRWSVDSIGPLRELLRLARDSDRVVALASDHGHVWHRPDGEIRSDRRSATDERGGRWRNAGAPPGGGELKVEGARVCGGGGAVVVPWDERIRYGTQQNGYHGGISPQEMVCPLVLLADRGAGRGRERPGFTACAHPRPAWWTAGSIVPPTPPSASESAAPAPALRTDPGRLFSMQPPDESQPDGSPAGHWTDRVVGSETYQLQRAMVRRHPPEDSVVREALRVLGTAGGTTTPAHLAEVLTISPARLDGFVAKLQQILNVDGYEVLSLDRAGDRVTLNENLLRRQFGIGED